MRRLAALVSVSGLSWTELTKLKAWELGALEEYHADMERMRQNRRG